MQVTSFVLKIIAIISMLMDHTSAALYNAIPTEMNWLYNTGRMIGRMAFPLFCFMIVEGYYHTRNKWRYLGSLIFLAVISELPFDAIFSNSDFKLNYNYQNVFFTLAIGLLTIILAGEISARVTNIFLSGVLQLFMIQIMLFAAGMLKSDYGSLGLELILMIYYFEKIPVLLKKDNLKFIFAATAVLAWFIYFDSVRGSIIESYGLPAVILIMLYNGKRGDYKIPKYVFYFFYPVHLIILYFVRKAVTGQ